MAEKKASAQGSKQDFVVKDFAGVNTQASRTAIQENEFAWLENLMPIGYANIKCVPHQGAIRATLAAMANYQKYVNVNNTDYEVYFTTNGAGYAVNLATFAITTIAPASTFSGATACAQWENSVVLIISSNGYWSWDPVNGLISLTAPVTATGTISGTTLTVTGSSGGFISNGSVVTGIGISANTLVTGFLSGTEGGDGDYTVNNTQTVGPVIVTITPTNPASGQTIATFSGAVWIGNNRTVSFSAPTSYTDFTVTDGGGSFTITDETLTSNITAMLPANNFLYIFGASSVNVVSNVTVQAGATIFSNTNISSQIGSTLPLSIFPYYRSIAFATKYGFYVLSGATPQKISDALDGIFPNIDFTKPVSGDVANIFNILCISFIFTYNDPVLGIARPLMAIFFNKKWFFASQGSALTIMSGGFQAGTPGLFATDGTNIYQLFSNPTNPIATTLQSALWFMKAPMRVKQGLKAGLEVTTSPISSSFTLTGDSDFGSIPITLVASNEGEWINNAGISGQWINNAMQTGNWVTSGFEILQGDFESYGRYIGYTIASQSPGFAINGLLMQHELRADWGTAAT